MSEDLFKQAIEFLHGSDDQHQVQHSGDDAVEWNIKDPVFKNGRLELDFVLAVKPPAKQLLGFVSRIAVRTPQHGFLAADSFSHQDAQQIRGGGYLNVQLPPGKYRGSYFVLAFVEIRPGHQAWPMKNGTFEFEV